MALAVSNSLRVAYYNGLKSEPVHHGIEGATQSFKKGAPLVYSSGKLVEATDAADQAAMAGMAAHTASGTTDTAVKYVPFIPGVIFEVTLMTGSEADFTLVQTNIGLAYAIAKAASGAWFLDNADTTNPEFRVVGFKDPVGTVNGRVYCVPLAAETIW